MKLNRFLDYFHRVRHAEPSKTRVEFIVKLPSPASDSRGSPPDRAYLLNLQSIEFDIDENTWRVKLTKGLAIGLGRGRGGRG